MRRDHDNTKGVSKCRLQMYVFVRSPRKGLFIAMPSKKAADGEYRDIAHPINSSTRENLQRVILESYEKALEEPEEAI